MIFFTIILAFIAGINFYVLDFSKTDYFYRVDTLEETDIWLVFWASVLKNETPSSILKDRIQVAFEAYKKWKINKIIVSGDNSKIHYNEPNVMKNYLINLWVKSQDIYPDYAWFDTYDSLYRARDLFKVKKIVLFTQDFHLKRAMYISKRLWLETYGVETNLQKYNWENYYSFREIFARIKAFLEVEILKSKPKYLWDTIKVVSDSEIEKVKKEVLEK